MKEWILSLFNKKKKVCEICEGELFNYPTYCHDCSEIHDYSTLYPLRVMMRSLDLKLLEMCLDFMRVYSSIPLDERIKLRDKLHEKIELSDIKINDKRNYEDFLKIKKLKRYLK
jgi:hypothetical protein